jgi:hypothetical protein
MNDGLPDGSEKPGEAFCFALCDGGSTALCRTCSKQPDMLLGYVLMLTAQLTKASLGKPQKLCQKLCLYGVSPYLCSPK